MEKKIRVTAIIASIIMIVSAMIEFTVSNTEDSHAASNGGIIVEEIEYDPEDREVSFEFYTRVKFRGNVKVYIYTGNSKNMVRYIEELDDDDLEVKVKRLKYGRKYKYKIKGIKKLGAKKYRTITGTFRAIDR